MEYKTRFKLFISETVPEKISQLARWLKRVFQILRKKGREHLTIMLIPHSEKQIFTLHISNFFLFFIGLILIIVITVASLNILSTSTSKQEVINLVQSTKDWKVKEQLIRNQIDNLNEQIEFLKPEIEKLYSSAAASEGEFIHLFAQGGSSDLNHLTREKIKETLPDKLPDEYYDLKSIQNDIQLSKKYIERVQNYIKERENMFSKIPSIWPLKVGGYITSDYGWRKHPFYRRKTEWHKGIDIASWPGAPIIATAEGKVIFAGYRGGYGLVVIIQHEYGFQTHYAHLSRIKTFVGRKVKKGDVIGLLGKTGMTTGYHLHYEVRIGLQDINPWPYIINIK